MEIDFVLDKKHAHEVKTSPTAQDERKLAALAQELKLKDYKIISRRFKEMKHTDYGFNI